MSKLFINGADFMNMVLSGASILKANVEQINSLNVFPVPDGDTGTNMNMTLTSGIEYIQSKSSDHIGEMSAAFSKGLLMGARGNSGVILSQLFRGFTKAVHDLEKIDTVQFAKALQQGVDTAYQAVVKPIEGTILTVAKESAKHAIYISHQTDHIIPLLEELIGEAKNSLARTPDLLPVLKQAGVVDSGGQGLVYVYEGFLATLKGEFDHNSEMISSSSSKVVISKPKPAQSSIETEDITHFYDMEFFIHLSKEIQFDESLVREELAKIGDSIVLIPDDEFVKVHVHSNSPGDVLNLTIRYGELTRLHIQNMRDQHREIVEEEPGKIQIPAHDETTSIINEDETLFTKNTEAKAFGMVTVSSGGGISDVFASIGVDHVLYGGQTMNPSTEDLINAVRSIHAEHVFILPNNSNIILAAQQAKELIEDKEVIVIPSKTIPQGMVAALALQSTNSSDENEKLMNQAIKEVQSGSITIAVRDSQMNQLSIKEGEYLGIHENQIVTASRDIVDTAKHLLQEMIDSDSEMLTIFSGESANTSQTNSFIQYIEEEYPDVEIEVIDGGQPIYDYIFSVE
ncbi:DAK2 domain-containing protein [Chengkuizengella axinellae]|uniref:DAK2 domain-containing protein n=1 Tax=Chengkuizengella axinellae TaxID=3064388 RepID=A0ABT9IX56_9BACL|nr:DAK2 domain-containing protein [Chengkuizengella sp. 2205SS18-9]MDP5273375.1 DAK2 domain-containing protein [Chengkuizengella sp. 2205SS18-9]